MWVVKNKKVLKKNKLVNLQLLSLFSVPIQIIFNFFFLLNCRFVRLIFHLPCLFLPHDFLFPVLFPFLVLFLYVYVNVCCLLCVLCGGGCEQKLWWCRRVAAAVCYQRGSLSPVVRSSCLNGWCGSCICTRFLV